MVKKEEAEEGRSRAEVGDKECEKDSPQHYTFEDEVQSLEIENSPQLTASKENGTSVLQLEGMEFCKHAEWAWKKIHTPSLLKGMQSSQHLDFSLWDS